MLPHRQEAIEQAHLKGVASALPIPSCVAHVHLKHVIDRYAVYSLVPNIRHLGKLSYPPKRLIFGSGGVSITDELGFRMYNLHLLIFS
jgi:hypothetical protein